MSRAFENAPNGLYYDVYGGAVPNSMLYRIKQIEGLSIKHSSCPNFWTRFRI